MGSLLQNSYNSPFWRREDAEGGAPTSTTYIHSLQRALPSFLLLHVLFWPPLHRDVTANVRSSPEPTLALVPVLGLAAGPEDKRKRLLIVTPPAVHTLPWTRHNNGFIILLTSWVSLRLTAKIHCFFGLWDKHADSMLLYPKYLSALMKMVRPT